VNAAVEARPLAFNGESGRWCIGDHDLHCGEAFWLWPDATYSGGPICVRIEHSTSQPGGWYLISPFGLLGMSTRPASLEAP
jgi:hypothetical protein